MIERDDNIPPLAELLARTGPGEDDGPSGSEAA